ncbi:hypothetical protein ABBQ38_003477 [Trebouxia sp. C0009 RCD-2024]
MGRVDSCVSWQVQGTDQGEYRTCMLCGGGKPAADQFCRSNDFSKAGLFQISTVYLDFTYSISDYKVCYKESCVGFDIIQCQTCQSDVPEQGSESEDPAASAETSALTPGGAPAPGPAASHAVLGVASLYSINSSGFCYNNGYNNVGCYNVGQLNAGNRNNGIGISANYESGTWNAGNLALGNNNGGNSNEGDNNRGDGVVG